MRYEVYINDLNKQYRYGFNLDSDIYAAIEEVRSNRGKWEVAEKLHGTRLRNIINIHNTEGVTSTKRIQSMYECIQNGQEICEEDNLPNCKIAMLEKGAHFLFDGHHTVLAYMHAGKKMLNQIPHIVIFGEGRTPLSSTSLHPCYGLEAGEKQINWKEKTINWNALNGEYIEDRKQKNMGELYLSLKDHIK